MSDDDDDDLDPGRIITCWCGAEGTLEELFDLSVFSRPCGGSGFLLCYCGGDFCVCHNHGEVECPGCPDCEPEDFDDDRDDGWQPDDYGYDDIPY